MAAYREFAGGIAHLHLQAGLVQLLGTAVDAVTGRVLGVELQAVEGEVRGGVDGVGPGQLTAEADVDHRQAGQRGAHHVELAGDGQVQLPEAQCAAPGKVRVGQEHAAPIGAALAAQGDGVAAAIQAEALGARRGVAGIQLRLPGAGRCGTDQRFGELPGAAFHQQAPGQAQQVVGIDGAQPALAQAMGGARIGLLQVAVEAGGVAVQQLGDLAGLRLAEGGDRGRLVEPGEEEVGRQVVEVGGGLALLAEPAGALATGGDDLLGQQAGVVAGIGIADAIAEAAFVRRLDVRDAVGGPADEGVSRRGGRGSGQNGKGRAQQQRCDTGGKAAHGHPKYSQGMGNRAGGAGAGDAVNWRRRGPAGGRARHERPARCGRRARRRSRRRGSAAPTAGCR